MAALEDTVKLRGRVAASAAATTYGVAGRSQEYYGLLLCTRLPSGKWDDSAHTLLSQLPPHMELTAQADGCDSELRLPYDLLIPLEQAREDFAAHQLGKKASPGDPDHSICNAHLVLATKGYLGTPERQEYWRGVLAGLAGKWAEVDVSIQRYSFRTRTGRRGQEKPVQRVGTRLVIRNIEELKDDRAG